MVKYTGYKLIDFNAGKIYHYLQNGDIKEAGWISNNGYWKIWNNKKCILIHRYLYEKYYNIKLNPKQQINHKNHCRNDNRIQNLELVNNQQNSQYKSKNNFINSSSKYKGVSWDRNAQKWTAQITVNCKKEHLGCYSSEYEAKDAYNKRALELNKQGHYYLINQ